jgi:hypothetical protein
VLALRYDDVLRRDGRTVITADHDPDDAIVVEAIITSFAPIRGASYCACGAQHKRWNLRHTAAGTAELYCDSCHRVHGYIGLSTRAYR